jgi:hypothetical protein
MSIQDLGSVGEFVGAIAVVVSLLYLAVQIRQNTRSMHASAVHQATTGASAFSMPVAESQEVARIFNTGLFQPEQLTTAEDRIRWLVLIISQFRHYEDVYLQYKNGTVGVESWEAWLNGMRPFLGYPGFPVFWSARGDSFTASFRAVVESERARLSEDATAAVDEFMGRST